MGRPNPPADVTSALTDDAPEPGTPGSAAPGPGLLGAVGHRDAVASFAWSWTRAVAGVTFIPGPRARARTTLEHLLHVLVRALRAEPFDPLPGRRVGADLVAARMSTPAVLGETLTLLGDGLLPAIGAAGDDIATHRLTVLLGQIAAGFTEALRGAAIGAAEEINRAERAAWRQQQQSLQRRLQYALLHDPLTGLPNRSQLLESLTTRIAVAAPGDRLGVCLFNVERFAAVNDTLGHDVGDRLLRRIAQYLRPIAIRRDYLLAHLGADEFALVLPASRGVEEAVKIVDQVLRTLPELFTVDGHRLPVAARAGIVECAAAGADPFELLRSAHIALGWAVADRHSPYAVFDQARCAEDIRRHNLAVRMPAALRTGEFTLEYQPLFRLSDRGVLGAEALVRWRHPELGTLGPDQFIPLAEQTGLIGGLGLYVLEEACAQAATWGGVGAPATSGGDPGRPFVSVNVAPAQLADPGLAAAVFAVLDNTGLAPARLQLEITESAAVHAHHHGGLASLADLGVTLAIDDFGTGYSSLAYLTELPVRTVKLAAPLVSTGPEGRPAAILPRVIDMCHDLGISVTAEGIETAGQAAELTALGCDTGQGYHLGRPMSPDRLALPLSAPPPTPAPPTPPPPPSPPIKDKST